MKKSDIEKRLKDGLDAATPSDFNGVWAKCENFETETEKERVAVRERALSTANAGGDVGKNKVERIHGMRIWAILLAIVLAFSAIGAAISIGMRSGKDSFGFSLSKGYFIFDINPSVEIDYDEEGKVTSAKGLNKDGEVLLCGVNLVGKGYREAAETVFAACVKLGYFSAARTDNAMLVSATKESGGQDGEMTGRIKELFSQSFVSRNIRGVVITGVDDPNLRAEAEALGIDAQKYALILECLSLGCELEEKEYAKISVRELYAKIAEAEKECERAEIERLNSQKKQTEEELFERVAEYVEEVIEQASDRAEDWEESFGKKEFEKFQSKIEDLEEDADRIEDAKSSGQCKEFVSKILKRLGELRDDAPEGELKELLNAAYTQLEPLMSDLETALKEIDKIGTTAEEEYAAREGKFGDDEEEDRDFDVDDWQEKHEQEFVGSWYAFKKQWNKDRESDLDD